MLRSSLRHLVLLLTLMLTPFAIVACDDKPETAAAAKSETSSAGKVTGNTYVNKVDQITIEFLPGNKAKLTDEAKTTELPWDTDGPDKVVISGAEGVRLVYTINAEGNLSDGMGSIFHKK